MFKRIMQQGLRIKLFNAITVIITVVMGTLVIASTAQLNVEYDYLIEAEVNYNESVSSANMLLAGSDNLTKQVQYFAQTADIAYMTAYFEEVDSARREQALAGLNVTVDEAIILNQAKQESDSLMVMEYHIMRLVTQSLGVEPDSLPAAVRMYPLSEADLALEPDAMHRRAREIAFGDAYRGMKDSIDEKIDVFTHSILERKLNTLDYYSEKVDRHIYSQQILLTILILMVVAAGVLIYIQVILVLKRQVNHIINDDPLEIRGVYELRYLSQVYNRLREKTHQTEKELEKRANLDLLTGILNRGAFEKLVSNKLIDGDTVGTFVMLDVDKFKSINDQYGHDIGDSILKKIAAYLSSNFRGGDLAGRLGGDEFGLWLSGLSADNVAYIQKRIADLNQNLLNPEDGLPPASMSAGIAIYTSSDDYLSLFKRADQALYHVKERGGCDYALECSS